MPAIVIAGAVAAVGAVGAAAISSSASSKAANKAAAAAQDATTQNNALARETYGKNEAALQPYMDQGKQATNALNGLVYGNDNGTQLQNLQSAPGYQFRMDQGNKSINSGYAARGMLQSGAAQKALLQYGQDYASNEYNNRYNQLAGQQGVGLSATNALAGVSTNYSNQVAGQNNANAGAIGNAALVGAQNTGNVLATAANALGNIGGSISSYGKPNMGMAGGGGGTNSRYGTPSYIPGSLYGGAFY